MTKSVVSPPEVLAIGLWKLTFIINYGDIRNSRILAYSIFLTML